MHHEGHEGGQLGLLGYLSSLGFLGFLGNRVRWVCWMPEPKFLGIFHMQFITQPKIQQIFFFVSLRVLRGAHCFFSPRRGSIPFFFTPSFVTKNEPCLWVIRANIALRICSSNRQGIPHNRPQGIPQCHISCN